MCVRVCVHHYSQMKRNRAYIDNSKSNIKFTLIPILSPNHLKLRDNIHFSR